MYRCEATSVEGFVQQLAVCYVGRGYWFYVAGSVPEGKDPRATDQRIISKYEIDVSKWTRARRRRLGFAGVHYLRCGRFFVLIASTGEHRFYRDENAVRDVRRSPIRFAGYSISYRRGRDSKWHPSVRIDSVEYRHIKRELFGVALARAPEIVLAALRELRFEPYAPIRQQFFQLLRAINSRRLAAGLELLPNSMVSVSRAVVRPFSDFETTSLKQETIELDTKCR